MAVIHAVADVPVNSASVNLASINLATSELRNKHFRIDVALLSGEIAELLQESTLDCFSLADLVSLSWRLFLGCLWSVCLLGFRLWLVVGCRSLSVCSLLFIADLLMN
jgi:hypothetical protein